MSEPKDHDLEETPARGTQDDADLGGYYARDTHRGAYGDDYARECAVAPPHGDALMTRDGGTAAASERAAGDTRRADARTREEITQRLSEARDLDASGVDVRVTGGLVLLTGSVTALAEARIAEQVAGSCSGVRRVENRINVARDDREIHIGKAME